MSTHAERTACKGCLIGAPLLNLTHACEEGVDAALELEMPPRHEQPSSPAQRLLAASCGVGEMPVAPARERP